ncbi:MAG: phosphonate ABC transporter, permease protein PhnE [Bdellovibrio sp.]|nr:MAG: phosphonate ABC transporter, permease protein PhnE [Bdellovibrio sp.]
MFSYLFCVLLAVIWGNTSSELLELERNVKIFLFGLGLGWGLSFVAAKLGRVSLGELIFASPHARARSQSYHARGAAEVPTEPVLRSLWFWQLLIFLVATFAVGVRMTQFSLTELLDQDGFRGAVRLFQGLLSPNWGLLPRAVANIIETFFMAFMATALAIPLAFVLCFVSAKNIMTHPGAFVVYMILRTLFNVIRSIEALIWAIIFSVWVGIGPFAGMLALMVHSVASLTKQYSEIVESVSEGPIEGIQSTGANFLQTIWFAIVPQVLLPFISFTVYRWDINIRMATIIGLVGGGGIGTLLILYQGQAMWHEVGTIIFVIAFVVWFMDTSSAYLRESLK